MGDAYDLPSSPRRFPDGAHYRIEIPGVEGPRALASVLDQAEKEGVTIIRISQGSGVMMLTDPELREMALLGKEARIEVSLFAGPRAAWDTGAQITASAGKNLGARQRGWISFSLTSCTLAASRKSARSPRWQKPMTLRWHHTAHLGPVAFAASIQMDAAMPNAFIQEQVVGVEDIVNGLGLKFLVEPNAFALREGHVSIPTGAGLGITVNEEGVREAAAVGHRWRVPLCRNEDGAVSEW